MTEVKTRANVLLQEGSGPTLEGIGGGLPGRGGGGGAAGGEAARAPPPAPPPPPGAAPGRDEVPRDGPRVHREGGPERPRARRVPRRLREEGGRPPDLGRGLPPEARAGAPEGRPPAGRREARPARRRAGGGSRAARGGAFGRGDGG